jgi:hypothetical protein
MKVLKTIVATAVIVFALTTVAMAGVQRIGSQGGAATTAGATVTQTHQSAGLTLTDEQFAQLLRAANGQGGKIHSKHADRHKTRTQVRDHSQLKPSHSAVHVQAQHRTLSQNASGGTQDRTTHHDGGTCND